MTHDRIITADASQTSGADFLDAIAPLFGKPTKADELKQAQIAKARKDYQDAIQRTFAIPRLWDQITARDALTAEFQMRIENIFGDLVPDADKIGDPLLKRDAA